MRSAVACRVRVTFNLEVTGQVHVRNTPPSQPQDASVPFENQNRAFSIENAKDRFGIGDLPVKSHLERPFYFTCPSVCDGWKGGNGSGVRFHKPGKLTFVVALT